MNPGKQLEVFQKYLETVPDYEKKLAALQYLNYPDNERENRLREWKGLIDPFYFHEDSMQHAINGFNDAVGFPLASYKRSTTPDSRGRYRFTPVYEYNLDTIRDYAKSILDKNGDVLPSMNYQKAA